MSQQTVEIVRNLYEAINRLGAASLLELPDAARRDFFRRSFDPELEIRQIPGLVDTAGTFRGYDGYLQATRELVEVLNGIRFELGKEYARGDSVVFDVLALATGRASGVPVEIRIAHLWELKEGLVRRWIVYPTLDEALEAAGLSE